MAKNASQQQQPQADNTHLIAYVVEKYTAGGEERSSWMRIGVAFPHKDGKGLTVQLQAIPVKGEIVLREPDPKSDDDDRDAR